VFIGKFSELVVMVGGEKFYVLSSTIFDRLSFDRSFRHDWIVFLSLLARDLCVFDFFFTLVCMYREISIILFGIFSLKKKSASFDLVFSLSYFLLTCWMTISFIFFFFAGVVVDVVVILSTWISSIGVTRTEKERNKKCVG
jgi:hypothetical protein